MARFANGSVVISMEDTHVLSTVAAAKSSEPVRDFLPLTVRIKPLYFLNVIVM
jgi:polyribonucleotide nucleotidyltransferase